MINWLDCLLGLLALVLAVGWCCWNVNTIRYRD